MGCTDDAPWRCDHFTSVPAALGPTFISLPELVARPLGERFDELANQWEEETWLLSNSARKIARPAHQTIVALGDAAVLLIIERLRR